MAMRLRAAWAQVCNASAQVSAVLCKKRCTAWLGPAWIRGGAHSRSLHGGSGVCFMRVTNITPVWEAVSIEHRRLECSSAQKDLHSTAASTNLVQDWRRGSLSAVLCKNFCTELHSTRHSVEHDRSCSLRAGAVDSSSMLK